MRMRTPFTFAALLLALPALASDPPAELAAGKARVRDLIGARSGAVGVAPENWREQLPEVRFEVRILKVPAADAARAGLKWTAGEVLSADELKRQIDAAQACPRASVFQLPAITLGSGKSGTVRVAEDCLFVTGGELTRVKGETVFVPRNTPVALGTTAEVRGRLTADGKRIAVRAKVTRAWLAGEVELVPVVTKVTPVFEGGSIGQAVPFTQYLQSPDVRTEAVERSAKVPAGGTLVLGGWKETESQPHAPKLKNAKPAPAEFACVALATVRVRPGDAVAKAAPVQPPQQLRVVPAPTAVRPPPPAAEKAPQPVFVSATVVQVPPAFVEKCGLGGKSCTLSPREARMLAELIRGARQRGECKILSEPCVCVADGRTASVRIGAQPVVPAGTVAGRDRDAQVETTLRGLTLEVTPRVAAGDSLALATSFRLGDANEAGAVREAAKLRFGESLVFASAPDAKSPVTLVILTPTRAEAAK